MNNNDLIVGDTDDTVFLYSLLHDELVDLNDEPFFEFFPAKRIDSIIGLTEANTFFGQYTRLDNQVRYFVGYLTGYLQADGQTAAGDYNADGTVDAADYVMWRRSLGGVVPFGTGSDGNANGKIDAADYEAWRSHLGQAAGSGSGSVNVPEPSCCVLFGLGMFCVRWAGVRR